MKHQVLFLHLLRTSGTSLLYAFLKGCPNWNIAIMMPEEFDREDDPRLQNADMVIGHWSRRHVDSFNPKRFIFTFLRDPVCRTLSNYFYYRHNEIVVAEPYRSQIKKIRNLTLQQFVESEDPEIAMYTRNTQTYALGYDWRAPRYALEHENEILSKALRFVRSIDFVGLVEYHRESTRRLEELLNLKLPEVGPLNYSIKRKNPDNIDPGLIEMIEEVNTLDRILYNSVLHDFLNDTA